MCSQVTRKKSSPMQFSSWATARAILQGRFSTKMIKSWSALLLFILVCMLITVMFRPIYALGIWSMIVSHLIEVVLIVALGFLLRWENQRRDRIQSQMEGGLEGRDLDATAFLDLTDRENLKYVALALFWSCRGC